MEEINEIKKKTAANPLALDEELAHFFSRPDCVKLKPLINLPRITLSTNHSERKLFRNPKMQFHARYHISALDFAQMTLQRNKYVNQIEKEKKPIMKCVYVPVALISPKPRKN